MKKVLVLILLFFISIIQAHAQQNSADSITCHRISTKNHGFYLFPYFYCQSRMFKVEGQNSWKHVGMFGDTLKSYLHPNSGAYLDMKRYKALRIAGVIQMWGLGLGSHIACIASLGSGESLSTGSAILLASGWVFYFSGAITYHLVAKKHYFRALQHHRSYCSGSQTYLEKPGIPSYVRVGSSASYPGVSLSYHF